MASLWGISRNSDLYVRQWDNEFVVYHEQSGDTYLFDNMGMAVLDYLKQNSADTQTILHHISQTTGQDIEHDQLEEMLGGLTRRGLIRKYT